jgi:hypothetical protein
VTYVLLDSAPNNAVLRCYGIFDTDSDDYVTLPDGTYCYGMTGQEAGAAMVLLNAGEMTEKHDG